MYRPLLNFANCRARETLAIAAAKLRHPLSKCHHFATIPLNGDKQN